MPIHQFCYLGLGFSVFHEDINLISFSLCSGVDRSWRLWLADLEALDTKTSLAS
jgi:hypothetical protein